MTPIKTIGIVGSGSVGISLAYLAQESGINVLLYKSEHSNPHNFQELMNQGNVEILNKTNNTNYKQKGTLKVEVASLNKIATSADLILNCCLFPLNAANYHFTDNELNCIKTRNTPVLAFPGKFGTEWLIGKGKIKVGISAYSPVFATKKNDEKEGKVEVTLLDFKVQIPLAWEKGEPQQKLIRFLNHCFKFRNDRPTFIDGGSPTKTSLSSPVPAINAAAICDNAQLLLNSNSDSITETIYSLSSTYAELFQEVYGEQITLSRLLGIHNMPSITDWLKNRIDTNQFNNVTQMLQAIYGDKHITITKNDRRITEPFYALLFLKQFANSLGCPTPKTNELLNRFTPLHTNIKNTASFKSTVNYILESATAYAQHTLKTNPSLLQLSVMN